MISGTRSDDMLARIEITYSENRELRSLYALGNNTNKKVVKKMMLLIIIILYYIVKYSMLLTAKSPDVQIDELAGLEMNFRLMLPNVPASKC